MKESTLPSSKKQSHLLLYTFIGMLLGIIVGLFFGEKCSWLEPLGSVYVLLLQMAVYPYVMCSILLGLGKLAPQVSKKLFIRSMGSCAVILIIIFIALRVFSNIIPNNSSSINVFQPVNGKIFRDLLTLLIPANPFTALSANYLPAIIIFCVFYGSMLQYIPQKNALNEVLSNITQASLKFWQWLVKYAPLGVFAMFSVDAGTLSFTQLAHFGFYIATFFIAALLLTFLILPSLICCFIPVRFREILQKLYEGLLLAVSTSLSVVALPEIQRLASELLQREGLTVNQTNEIVIASTSVGYAFAQLGNCFVYFFILFASFYYGHTINSLYSSLLPFMTYLSSIGPPSASVASITFLTNWLNFPPETTSLYVSSMVFTRYAMVIVSVMGICCFTLIMTFTYYEKIKIRWQYLIVTQSFNILLLTAIAIVAYHLQTCMQQTNTSQLLANFVVPPELSNDVHASVLPTTSSLPTRSAGSISERIKQQHLLRVGFDANEMPFCYYNKAHQLVGFDVELIYHLANDLQTSIQFIPLQLSHLETAISNNSIDIAIGGIMATPGRLLFGNTTKPIALTSIVFIAPQNNKNKIYQFIKHINNNLIIGVPATTAFDFWRNHIIKNARIFNLDSYDNLSVLFTSGKVDAVIWAKEKAKAWVLAHPGYTVIVPNSPDFSQNVLIAYATPKDDHWTNFLNYWLMLQQNNGLLTQLSQHWLQAIPRSPNIPRWSIWHNVLGQ